MKIKSILSYSLGLVLIALATTASAAGVIRVDDSDSTPDTSGCGSAINPCNTIQQGVNQANPGDTVRVAPGTYNELVTVNKTLTLRGAQAGNNAVNRSEVPANESTVGVAGGGFNLTANNIVLDGFVVRGASTNPLGAGIATAANTSGHRIVNNIIRDNTFGLSLNSNGVNQTVVRHNAFRTNNLPGAASGNGIYSDQGLSNAVIADNYFTGHNSAAMVLVGTQSDLTINQNRMVDDNSIVSANTTNSRITNNESIRPNGTALFLGGGNSGLTIRDNTLRDGTSVGISLNNNISSTPNSFNQINNNTIRQFNSDGIRLAGNATNNTFRNNTANANGRDGIRINAGSGNQIIGNTLRNNVEHDAHDNTTGTGTAGTNNFWNNNNCQTSTPAGLCS